jgi:hypothetical protein
VPVPPPAVTVTTSAFVPDPSWICAPFAIPVPDTTDNDVVPELFAPDVVVAVAVAVVPEMAYRANGANGNDN